MKIAVAGSTGLVGSAIKTSLQDANWEDHVEVDEKYLKPTEVDALIGDPSKARIELD